MVTPAKVAGYKSDFMDPPLLEHFESYKKSGVERHGLELRTYQVVEVSGYPHSELFLKNRTFHDFFVHCGLHAVPSQDLCTLGKTLDVKVQGASSPVRVNLYIKLSKAAVADWRMIEDRLTPFMSSRIALDAGKAAVP